MDKIIHVVRLIVQETGRYDQQYSRPYQAVANSEVLDTLGRRIDEVTRTNHSMKINGSVISGLSGGLIVPSASWERELAIPYGWGEQRLRFMLEVHVETALSTELYYFQGYTEYLGVSLQGSIDPDMAFYINSYMRVTRMPDMSAPGLGRYMDIITETAQVIDGRYHSTNSNANAVFGLRPEDVFTGVQSAYLTDVYKGLNEGSVIDTRVNRSRDIFQSRRNNAIPSNYLGRVIENYRTANALIDFGQGSDDIYSRAIQSSYEDTPYANPFIRALSENRFSEGVTHFSMNDLCRMDPNTPNVSVYNTVGQGVRLHQTGDAESWMGATLEVQLATIIANSVNAMMVENMLISVAFTSTNMTMDAQLDTRIISGQGVTTVDMRQYFQNFMTRFEQEVMPDITKMNTIPVAIMVEANLNGDTKIDLSLDGGPYVPFISPSFCDSLLAPIVTTTQNDYYNLLNGFESIVNRCKGTDMALASFGQHIDNSI